MSNQDRQFFIEHGFLGPFKVYEPEEAKCLLKEIRRKNLDKSRALYNNDCNYDRHFDIDELTKHIAHEAIVKRLQLLLGHDILCWRTEFFPKFPGSKGTEWHQVEKFQYTTGAPQLQPLHGAAGDIVHELTAWTCFTESNKENGCLKFLPGTHLKMVYDESKTPKTGREGDYASVSADTSFFGYNYADFKIDPTWEPDESKAVPMIMKPGACVIFTARCIHGSFPNTTRNATRFAISSRYVSTDVRVYPCQTTFHEHGGDFDLKHFGTVLVSGRNDYTHNRLRDANNHGVPFPTPLGPHTDERRRA
jgi:non-haem Fe2+, alpha-ketoglutarate-dependent halogenase